MTTFEYLSVALSFVLGLGVTRLLLGALRVFGARQRQQLHWIPIIWAVGIFILQIQFWWSIFELNELLETWTQGGFAILLGDAILLFIAGAMILPTSVDQERQSLIEYFEQEGRWALLALTAYSAVALWGNWFLFGASPLSVSQALVAVYGGSVFVAFMSSNRWILSVITVAQLFVSIYIYLNFSPTEY